MSLRSRFLIIFFGCTFSVIVTNASSEIIFQDNFDDHSDWSPEQSLIADYGNTTGAVDGSKACVADAQGHIPCPNGTAKYSAYYQARAAWPDWKGNNTLNISPANARGGKGKALTLWMEPIDSTRCDGGTKWCSDGQLSVNLPKSYSEIFIRYYIKFQPDWVWAKEGGGGKFFRASHYHNYQGVEYYKFFKDGNHFPIAILDIADQAYYGTPTFSEMHMHYRFSSAYYPASVCPSQSGYVVANDFARYKVPNGTGVGGYKQFIEWIGDGKWHSVQIHLKGNSAMGVSDGMYEVFIDDIKTYSQTNVVWAGTCKEAECANCINPPQNFVGWNWVSIGGNQKNTAYPVTERREQWYVIDDFVVSTEYIPEDRITTIGY